MKQYSRFIKWGVLLVVIVALVAGACAPKPAAPQAEKSIKVGMQMAISAFGGSPYITSVGFLNYCQYVNDELGGIKYKDPITGKEETVKMDLLWEDAGYNPARAISVYKKQQAAGVKAMMAMGSGTQDGLLEFAIRDHMPLWGNCSSTSIAMVKTQPKWWTSSFYSMADGAGAVVDYIKGTWKESRSPKLVLILPDVPACRGLLGPEDIDNYAKSKGVELVAKSWVPFALTDATVELTRAREANADFVYSCNTTVGWTAVLMKDALRLGMKDRTQFINYPYSVDDSLAKLASEAVEGLICDFYAALPTDNVPGVKMAQAFCQKYIKQDATSLYFVPVVHAVGFVEMLRVALERNGYAKISGDTIRDGMYNIKNLDTRGLTGKPINISEQQICQVRSYRMVKVDGGKFKAITDWAEVPTVTKY